MPPAMPGMVIGLFGGSFNPPHPGHALVADIALRRLRLDRLWWMVTPGNPLKTRNGLLPLADRLALSAEIAHEPRIIVTGFEQALGMTYTAEVVAAIRARHPAVHFVWIMGADNLTGFHRWQDWQRIAETVPVAIIDRPGATLASLSSVMARRFGHARIDEAKAASLAFRKAPAWTFLHGPRSTFSSTAIRSAREGQFPHLDISPA